MLPIPITRHMVVVEGSSPVVVLCEQCGLEYVYTTEQKGYGEAIDLFHLDETAGQARARQQAQRVLDYQFRHANDPVPCPSCGSYQAAMVRQMRMLQFHWMLQLGVTLCVLFPFLVLISLFATWVASPIEGLGVSIVVGLFWLGTGSILVAAPALFILRPRYMEQYNPNDEDLEARKQMGRRLALPKDDYVKMIREMRKNHLL